MALDIRNAVTRVRALQIRPPSVVLNLLGHPGVARTLQSRSFQIWLQIVTWSVQRAVILTLGFFLASYFSLGVGTSAAINSVRTAFDTGHLMADFDKAIGSTTIGVHQYNDCLIMGMAIDQRPGLTWKLTISPIVTSFEPRVGAPGVPGHDPYIPKSPTQELGTWDHPCPVLYRLAFGETPTQQPVFYHRYMHGHTVLARYLLPIASVETIRLIFSLTTSTLVMAGLLFCCFNIAKGTSALHSILWFAIFLSFARWFGLESFGQSFSHGPSDSILLAYLLFLCVRSRPGLSYQELIKSAAIFGGLTMIFEFLTGGIPLGLAIVIAAVPLSLNPDEKIAPPLSIAVYAVTSFCIAAVLCLAIKVVIALIVFGPSVASDFLGQLGERMALTANNDVLPHGGVGVFVSKVVGGLSALAGQMRLMSGLTLLGAVVFGIWGASTVLASDRCDANHKAAVQLLLGSNIPIFAWLVVFWQHTIQHAWFMDRILVWTIATGFALFAMGAVCKHGATAEFNGSQDNQRQAQ